MTLAERLKNPDVRKTGIPLKGPLAEAIDRGDKTNTMRVVVPQPTCVPCRRQTFDQPGGIGTEEVPATYWQMGADRQRVDCPYGGPGDLLYTREGYRICEESWAEAPGVLVVEYKRDGHRQKVQVGADVSHEWLGRANPYRWRPSIHFPQFAARQWMLIKAVEVRRPFPIDIKLVMAEGVPIIPLGEAIEIARDGIEPLEAEYVRRFTALWDGINAKRGYGSDVNPWCWSIRFRKL